MISGACNCGAVAFEVDSLLTDVVICHCSICRRATGSNGIAVVLAEGNAFRWLQGQGEISNWKKPDGDWQLAFCRHCGSPLPGANDGSRVFIPVGLISSGAESLKVGHHIWVNSRAHWDVIGDDGIQHPNRYAE